MCPRYGDFFYERLMVKKHLPGMELPPGNDNVNLQKSQTDEKILCRLAFLKSYDRQFCSDCAGCDQFSVCLFFNSSKFCIALRILGLFGWISKMFV